MDINSVEEFDKRLEQKEHPTLLVIVAAEWCGACKRLEESVWKPFCNKKDAPPNVIRISDEVFPNTKLGQKTPIQYYPTVLEVTSSGTGEQVATPVKTPRSVEELRSLALTGVSSAETMDMDRIPNA
jgi:thiol-disulfide isomerase/thioredoxin